MFRSAGQILFSNRGQILLPALAFSVGVLVMTGFLLDQSTQTDKNLRVPRVKSVMNGIEAKIRLAALQPQTFSCPASATATFNSSLCTLNTTFSEMNEVIPGCQSTSPSCGVIVQNLNLSGTTLSADVVYQGTDLAVKPIHIVIDVPQDVLQASDYNCASIDPTRPLFAGYNSDGSLRCRPLPSDCPAGQYASSVDPSTLALNCAPLPTPANACSLHQYMTGVSWTGASTFNVTCSSRLDPFAYYSFTPTLVVRTTPYSSPSPAPVNGVCTPIATTTTSTTTTTTSSTTIPVCTPGVAVDTGCVADGVMGTWDGCSSGTRADASCAAVTTTTTVPVPTTTTTVTTTTTIPVSTTTTTSSTTTTTVACAPSGAASWVSSGADDTNCVSVSPFPWSAGSSSNPWCCSGTHHPNFGPADTIGAGCMWICD